MGGAPQVPVVLFVHINGGVRRFTFGLLACRVVYRGTGEAEERLALGGHHRHSDDAVTLRDLLVRSHAVGNDGGVAGHAWRASTVLQAERWLCSQCDIAFGHAVSICPSCNVESATVRFEANESLHARARGVHDSAYGRQLRFLQHREQHTGVIPSLGRFTDDNYEDLVQQSVNEVGDAVSASDRPDWLPEGVRHFHAYIQIISRSQFGFACAADAKALMASGRASKALSEMVILFGSRTSGVAPDGGETTVQRHPKGGFFRLIFAEITEHDFRIGRSILGAATDVPASCFSYLEIGRYIRDGKLLATSDTYIRLHSLAASLFVSVAVRELSEGGRLFNPDAPQPQRSDWFANEVHIPRCYVAELASTLLSLSMGDRVSCVEDARISSQAKTGFVSLATCLA